MKKNIARVFAIVAAVMFMSIAVLESNAEARAGGGRSSGYRGSRSYSQPNTSYSQPSQSRQQYNTAPNAMQQRPGGGFLRGMAGGIMGGLLGGMLFSSLGFAGGGNMGGGGIGILEILLLAGIGYMIYRFVKKKREASLATPYGQTGYQAGTVTSFPSGYNSSLPVADTVDSGIANIRSMDASFDEQRFKDSVMDTFFRIQGAWMNRDLAPVSILLTEEMKNILQEDVSRLLRDRQVNRLENIAVRSVEIAEAWQESGQDFITASIYANLLDYTTDDATGAVVSGNRTEPVKFEEYWTFTRPVGANAWRLSAIDQK
ncbi:transport protein, Tim44-like domain, putative [Geotalea daltonii FRC-32]|uniref:Transport protein, Tim44-like domain, putative n=1 Tax=Geotalea daltonii (strain DSM 22248 / JCM 15807 / FRC-32) TaxID=316067 RepID=B9M277_GEODF|nr:Tim44 domain-containing protein [Geotalea daltonii]ACM21195.1 transport protein, Tim44-like domain, putative [Geotalea daltonii FRC-32]